MIASMMFRLADKGNQVLSRFELTNLDRENKKIFGLRRFEYSIIKNAQSMFNLKHIHSTFMTETITS